MIIKERVFRGVFLVVFFLVAAQAAEGSLLLPASLPEQSTISGMEVMEVQGNAEPPAAIIKEIVAVTLRNAKEDKVKPDFAKAAGIGRQEDKVTAALKQALLEHNAFSITEPSVRIEITVQNRDSFKVSPSEKLSIMEIAVTKRSKRYMATLLLKDAEGLSRTVALQGKYDEFVTIPTLKNSLLTGDVVREADISYTEINSNRLNRNSIMDVNNLIGKTARRMLRANNPVSTTELGLAQSVIKNKMVTMVYRDNALILRTAGIALDSGAAGDVIRVKNAKSNQIVQATVEDVNVVRVESILNR
jgi:flagella basal body P-ring formation protein FlgA